MAYEVLMPQLGLTMEEGTVSQWIKHEGDEVKTGDVIVEITTDKLTNEVASEHDGVTVLPVPCVSAYEYPGEHSATDWERVTGSLPKKGGE